MMMVMIEWSVDGVLVQEHTRHFLDKLIEGVKHVICNGLGVEVSEPCASGSDVGEEAVSKSEGISGSAGRHPLSGSNKIGGPGP